MITNEPDAVELVLDDLDFDPTCTICEEATAAWRLTVSILCCPVDELLCDGCAEECRGYLRDPGLRLFCNRHPAVTVSGRHGVKLVPLR